MGGSQASRWCQNTLSTCKGAAVPFGVLLAPSDSRLAVPIDIHHGNGIPTNCNPETLRRTARVSVRHEARQVHNRNWRVPDIELASRLLRAPLHARHKAQSVPRGVHGGVHPFACVVFQCTRDREPRLFYFGIPEWYLSWIACVVAMAYPRQIPVRSPVTHVTYFTILLCQPSMRLTFCLLKCFWRGGL